jgi:hypothetical protein
MRGVPPPGKFTIYVGYYLVAYRSRGNPLFFFFFLQLQKSEGKEEGEREKGGRTEEREERRERERRERRRVNFYFNAAGLTQGKRRAFFPRHVLTTSLPRPSPLRCA